MEYASKWISGKKDEMKEQKMNLQSVLRVSKKAVYSQNSTTT